MVDARGIIMNTQNAPAGYDHDAARYALAVALVGEGAYLIALWPSVSLGQLTAAMALGAMLLIEVYLVCSILLPWVLAPLSRPTVALDADQEWR